nr:uncharacterized protein DDB_G0283357 isoform X1 [Helicoverpa armigera]XP_049707184.1 uncharacterized protein DDB_G0283357 isoform X2 [Helicoverpa armigera]XP_049707185.1 uncharacterized protein DDB_G0283357 isoform X3 [Helicoverpa armigera]XP_049707186.1 uncharacterized protein DDB_G0283357 isoform X4 [Helicoverpa armigera]XP_049707187.1 uncharacterized protein DDB_G0283357 isoform X5 [Helicoverpa armigera]XP_049707188.1 uncharacterized protein DDB_G0283357 isoform X6 [Helicoverpa armigera]
MADSFFGFDTSLSNLNDDEGGGEPSEDEYDALNDETFGQGSDEFDWEVEHEQLAEQLESSRRHNSGIDDLANTQLEASLSQLVLDETDAPHSRSFSSNVWRHDPIFPSAPTPVQGLKNVCTVEELERQLRQKQVPQPNFNQNYFQPRFPPVILQRPPGLQAPVPLPFAPQQSMSHNMNQPLTKLMNQMGQNNQLLPNHVNQMGQNVTQFMNNQIGNQFQNNPIGPGSNMMNQLTQNMSVHQMGQNNQMMGQNVNQMGQNLNMSQSMGQMGQSMNQMGQNVNQMGQNMGQNVNQMSQNMSQMGQNVNQMGQNMQSMGQNLNQMNNHMGSNQMGQNPNQMGQNPNQMGQNVNQMMQNGNQFPGMSQFQHMMGQPRMMGPPPGINMQRPNFNSNMGQYNPNFRPSMPSKPEQPINQPNMMINQPMLIKNQPQPINNIKHSPSNQMNHMNQINQINQSPQSKNTPKPVPKDQKVQKSRVYNNSKQTQNLTSQNLVQLIQNTHPMLQFNNSFHNANHHPMLNNRNNVFTNSQFSHPMFNNQRVNGTFNNRHSINGDDASGSDTDEYAGLMTAREKQWLINIQMLQLNTGTPYIHDFYYTVFLERQASKEKEGVKEAHKANQQNHPFYSGGVKQESHTHRERHNSNRHNSTSEDSATPRTYVPTQFENSLGKLQCGSVTAPRKIIDVEVVGGDSAPSRMSRASSVASTTHPTEVPREMKRTKQLLLDIEALYLILLRLEELNDPLAISNALILKEREEKQKQLEAAQKEAESEQQEVSNLFLKNIESVQRRPKQDSPKSESIDKRQVVNLAVNQKPVPTKNLLDEDKDDLINKMFAGLLHSDRVQQMLTVRKGRTLITRFVSRVPASHGRLRWLWARVLRALPHAARRDDTACVSLAKHYTDYIQTTSGWAPILESCGLLSEAFDPARTPYALTTAFTLSCVCALIDKASMLVNTPEATSNERQWSKFLKTLARALKNTTLTVARPVKPMSATKLTYHMKQLDSRTTIEILQRGKTAEFADLTKTEVAEQLIKYLC